MTVQLEITPALARENARWRAERLATLPQRVRALVMEEVARLDAVDYRAANQRMGQLARDLERAHVGRAYDEDEIRAFAESYARACSKMPMLTQREEFARSVGVEPPAARFLTDRYEGRAARLADPQWWRRQLRKAWTRAAEDALRDLGIVRRGREPYASEDAVRYRAAQKRRASDFLHSCVAVNESDGTQLQLWEVAQRSLANPALRRGEFMCRCRGFEQIARDLGHVALFCTLTAPSRFHPQLARGGRNPRYQRETVRAAQAWLRRMWARARAKLHRLAVVWYGFRIAEPHHDGTPHWHLLIFAPQHAAEIIRIVLRAVWLSEYADEPGAAQHRCRFEWIDANKGSATGYVAKYVAKNLDGAGEIGEAEDLETGESVASNIARVDAWASLHGIRQFQQIGGPPVTLWREARRLRDSVADADIERARAAADRGDWRAFCYAVGEGGQLLTRRTALKLHKEETGELNKYGECRGPRVLGLRYCSALVITRPNRWRIERKGQVCENAAQHQAPQAEERRRRCVASVLPSLSSRVARSAARLGPVAITVRAALAAGEPSTWTNPQESSRYGPH